MLSEKQQAGGGSALDSSFAIPRDEILDALWRHAINPWFPRCLDREYGGFLCDFDRAWRADGSQEKFLEFQARQTWFAAAALEIAPDNETLREAALHGLRFLEGPMWDSREGGWYHCLDRAGEPRMSGVKHAHGSAYAIAAASALARALNDKSALELATAGFRWIDDHAYDRARGGYFGPLARDGRPLVSAEDSTWGTGPDLIGTPLGFKDANVQNDLLEALYLLSKVAPDALVRERMRETADFLSDRLTGDDGSLYYLESADDSPMSGYVQYGHCFQSAYRVLRARDLLGDRESGIAEAERWMAFALINGRDDEFVGFHHSNLSVPGGTVAESKKWWVQLEAFHALAEISAALPDSQKYRRELKGVWEFLKKYQFDTRYGGVYLEPLAGLPWWRRLGSAHLAPAGKTRKGSQWKYVAHEGLALIRAAELCGPEPGDPLGANRVSAPAA